ncbi:MAG: TnsA endonuclease N-terminal domain-containing protein [Magnetovibrio sp.]|nr:TnsA endonuclease N-terminal domain-containing protein [Magnetovibrio sp.]
MNSDKNGPKDTRKSLKENRSDQLFTGVSDLFRQNNGVVPIQSRKQQAEAELVAAEIKEMLMLLKGFAEAEQGVREIRANHRSITGWVNGDYGAVPFESTVEMDFAYLALFDARVVGLHSQPITINYEDENSRHRHYTPDFLVEYTPTEGQVKRALVEIKLASEMRERGNYFAARFRAAENWCVQHDFEFYLVTDEQIRTDCINNIKALYPFRFAIDFRNFALCELEEKINASVPISIAEVLDTYSSTPAERAEVQKMVWILIATQALHIDLSKAWHSKTILYSHPVWHDPNLFFTMSREIREV